MSAAPILEVSRLRVERGRTAVLRGLDWRVAPGEHWVILGANGSGKTSLLKSLTGFLSPTAGEISVLGQRYGASDWRALRFKIGVVTSGFVAAIPPAEVALETVVSGKFAQLDLWQAGTRADRAAAMRLLRLVGLARLADREWAHLSQGERQRVLIARALMARPRLLILDEPSLGVAPLLVNEIFQLIQRLRGEGITILLAEQNARQALSIADRGYVIENGQMVMEGAAAALAGSADIAERYLGIGTSIGANEDKDARMARELLRIVA